MARSLIRTLKLPRGSDARALADEVAEHFHVASISGSGGEHEIQLVSPAALVVVIDKASARFFVQDLELDAEDDDDDDEDPDGTAQEISDHLARFVGLAPGADDEDGEDEKPPLDNADKLAEKVVALLLERGLLEITTPRSRPKVEARLAHCIDRGVSGGAMCDALTEVPGVAELYTTDEEIEALVAECRGKGTSTQQPAKPAAKARAKSTSRSPATSAGRSPAKRK